VDLGPSGSMATAVKYNLKRDSQSEFLTVSSPFGHEGKNLESLFEKRAESLRTANTFRVENPGPTSRPDGSYSS